MQISPVVMTSLNPHGRIEHQLRCFHAWKAHGIRICSVNIGSEIARLRQLGLEDADLIELAPGETAKNLHYIPTPRILPVLYRLQHEAADTVAMLVNSDIYPAIRSADALMQWAEYGPALALTREECACPETHTFQSRKPYRGGLDAFLLAPNQIGKLINAISRYPVAERMAFGIPGWDYLMGLVIRSPVLGGKVLDSGLLLHESHPASYSNMTEFGHYLSDIAPLIDTLHEDPTQAAAEVASLFTADCIANGRIRDLMKALHYTQPSDLQAVGPEAREIATRIMRLSPSLIWHLQSRGIAALAQHALKTEASQFSKARSFFEVNPDPQFRFTQCLIAILFCLMCGRNSTPLGALTTNYPPGNLHGKVVEMIQKGYPPESPWRRLEFLQLFGSELLDHGIFNPRLFNYLVESCATDEERSILTAIMSNIRSYSDAA